MAPTAKLNRRYEQIEILGEGGMGVVYRAYDSELRREVTLKTVRDIQDKMSLELFKKEINVLSGMAHPNIVEIYDVGEISEPGGKRPYFVMPLLRGVTLDKLIKSSSQRLSVARCVDIISQVCRGLQAAHDIGLVHRDLKPSNIFVLEDDSVKIIDFGVAHLVDAQSTAGLKGTLLYMAPEQLLLKKPSPLSDLFSLAAVCFMAMTRRHPFSGATQDEIADAIINRIPPPASDFNHSIAPPVSQVIHKGMAKQPFQRFASAREFAENLQKAFRNEPIECFNPERVEERVLRAKKAFDEGQLGIASDILSELENEASLHPEIAPLRKQIDSAQRQKTIAQLLDTARRCYEGHEYQLALQKVQEVLNLDSTNTEARSLQGEIENQRSSDQIEDWCRIALQHLANHSYNHAREAVRNVLKIKPKEARAQQLMVEVDRREQEYVRLRQEKDKFYQDALHAMQKGELSSALTKLERVLEMDRRAPDTFAPDRSATYQKLYNEVRTQHDLLDRGYAEARGNIDAGNFPGAIAICNDFLAKYPEHAMFQSLRLDAEDRHRQQLSAFVARVGREVEEEPDLARRIRLLEDALEKHPDEPHFTRSLESNRAKRDLVESIVAKARAYETGGQYSEALDQWKILRDIYRQYPGLDFEADRVQKRREQKDRSDAKGRWVGQIDRALTVGDYARGSELCATALSEFPGDSELLALERTSQQGRQRVAQAQQLLEEAHARVQANDKPKALELLRQAYQIEPSAGAIRAALLDVLIADAKEKLETDWRAAEEPVQEVLELDPGNARAKSLRTLISDKKKEEHIADVLSRARELKDGGDLKGALAALDEALLVYPKNVELLQRRAAVEAGLKAATQQQLHKQDLNRAKELGKQAEREANPGTLRSILDATQMLASKYPGDANFETLVFDVKTRLQESGGPPVLLAGPNGSAPAASAPARPKSSRSLPRFQPKHFAAMAACVAVALLIAAIVSVMEYRSSPLPPGETVTRARLALEVAPADTEVAIYDKDGKPITGDRDNLPLGEYVVRASAPGYQPREERVRLTAKGSAVNLTLTPLSQAFELVSDVQGLTITMDGQSLTANESGQFAANQLSESQHTMAIATPGGGRANLVFLCKSGAAPEIVNFTADRLRIVALASFKNSARMVKPSTDREKVSVSFDGGAAEELTSSGIARDGLTRQHALLLTHGKDTLEQSFVVNPAPKLAVFIADQNLGTLIVDVGYQDVVVELDGKARRASKLKGDRLILGVLPKEYVVRITKDGYYPEEQKIAVRKGESQTFQVALRAVASHGSLVVRNGAGAEVSVGDSGWQAAGDGSQPLQVPLGRQMVRVRKSGFRTWEEFREFQPDKEVSIDVGQLNLQSLEATVSFVVTPADATLKLTGPDGKDIPMTGRSAKLREGRYVATGAAPNFDSREIPFNVTAGKDRSVELALTRKTEVPKPVVAGNPMDGWDLKQWNQGDGGWYRKVSEGSVFYSGSTLGTFTFTVIGESKFLRSNKFRVLVDYRSSQDYIAFEVQKDKIVLIRRRDGRKTVETSKPHRLRLGDAPVHVRLIVNPEKATISIANRGNDWSDSHSFEAPGPEIGKGRLGLDNVEALSNFKR